MKRLSSTAVCEGSALNNTVVFEPQGTIAAGIATATRSATARALLVMALATSAVAPSGCRSAGRRANANLDGAAPSSELTSLPAPARRPAPIPLPPLLSTPEQVAHAAAGV